MSSLTLKEQDVLERLKARFGDGVAVAAVVKRNRPKIMVAPERLLEVAAFLKELGFDHVISVGGTDYPSDNQMEVFYHTASVSVHELRRSVAVLATRVPRDNPRLRTVSYVWPSAEFHERETFEMLGVTFEGHPKLQRLLLPEDWDDIPPLRKEYRLPGR